MRIPHQHVTVATVHLGLAIRGTGKLIFSSHFKVDFIVSRFVLLYAVFGLPKDWCQTRMH